VRDSEVSDWLTEFCAFCIIVLRPSDWASHRAPSRDCRIHAWKQADVVG
jgi:hypothetical protein